MRKLAVTDDKNKNDKDKNHSEDGDDTFSVDFQKAAGDQSGYDRMDQIPG